jgi:XRE family transcriptional regulator, regulator of sulfur utilization
MNAISHRFGAAVRALRESRGWSQEQLAGRADLNRSYLGEVERGDATASLATVEKLACALQLSPADLLLQCEGRAALTRGLGPTAA